MKQCTECKELLHAPAFGVNRASKDGLNAACKSCKRKRDRRDVSRTGRTRKAADRLKRIGRADLLIDTDIQPGVLEALHLLYAECGRCKQLGKHSSSNLTTDHVIPIEKNGLHRISNIGFLCPGHNRWKRDRIMKDYRQIVWLDVILWDGKEARSYSTHTKL